MASEAVFLGVIVDAEDDEIEVSADADGTVSLEWEHGSAMVLGPVARDALRELLDRAAMPGQAEPAIAHIATDPDAHRRHGCPTCLEAARAMPGASDRG